jgi:biopolymer transport protein TolQ
MDASASLPTWIIATQWASRAILVLLVALSIWSVAIMVDRYRALKGADALQSLPLLEEARRLIAERKWAALKEWATRTSTTQATHPVLALPAGALKAALETGSHLPEGIDRAVRSYLSVERTKLEQGLTTLATLGSNAPFIGLFGTVLGIIQAFGALATQSSASASVMTGISEALVATAVGLFVAIPAVVAYNIFSRQMKKVLVESEALRDLYLSRITTGDSSRGG